MNKPSWTSPKQRSLSASPKTSSGRVTHVRGTLLTSSMRALRERALFDRYLGKLPEGTHKEDLLSVVASTWLPIDVAQTHYDACNALGIDEDELVRIGEQVSERMQGSFLGTLLRLGKNGGLTTPDMALAQYDRYWERLMIGGSVNVVQIGPKDVQLEIRGLRLASIPYFRIAFRGVNRAGVECFCRKAYVNDIPQLCNASALGYHIAWV